MELLSRKGLYRCKLGILWKGFLNINVYVIVSRENLLMKIVGTLFRPYPKVAYFIPVDPVNYQKNLMHEIFIAGA